MKSGKSIITSCVACIGLTLSALATGEESTLVNRALVGGGTEYGKTVTGDTLWSIAVNVSFHQNVTVSQAMLALLRTNSEAFAEPNIHLLKVGYVLWVPEHLEFFRLSAEEAMAEVRRQNQEQGTYISAADATDDMPASPPEEVQASATQDAEVAEESVAEPLGIADSLADTDSLEPRSEPEPPAPAIQDVPTRSDIETQPSFNFLLLLGVGLIIGIVIFLARRWKRSQSNEDAGSEGTGSEEAGSKVDLARAYIEMGDKDAAVSLLRTVLAEGSVTDIAEANELLKTLS